MPGCCMFFARSPPGQKEEEGLKVGIERRFADAPTCGDVSCDALSHINMQTENMSD